MPCPCSSGGRFKSRRRLEYLLGWCQCQLTYQFLLVAVILVFVLVRVTMMTAYDSRVLDFDTAIIASASKQLLMLSRILSWDVCLASLVCFLVALLAWNPGSTPNLLILSLSSLSSWQNYLPSSFRVLSSLSCNLYVETALLADPITSMYVVDYRTIVASVMGSSNSLERI